MTTLSSEMTPSTQYATRPADERFVSFPAMLAAARADQEQSHEARYNLRDLRATVGIDRTESTSGRQTLLLESPKGRATFTHYSFGQLARTIGAPASYLRTLPMNIAADAINFGLHDAAPVGTRANILVRDDAAKYLPEVRACTSETYGRVWDATLYGELDRHFGDGRPSSQGTWQSPPVWPGQKPGGQYRGDRDSFVIRIDGGSIVSDPRGFGAIGDGKRQGGQLNRGILVRNSEVGHCSIYLDTILFDAICGNHMIWGLVIGSTFKRRHVGMHAAQDAIRELVRIARQFNQRTASEDERIIKALVAHELAHSEAAIVDELMKAGYTKEQAKAAYATAEAKEPNLNPRSYWGIATGTTRLSQESGWQDDRYALDKLAADLLKRGVKQFATV